MTVAFMHRGYGIVALFTLSLPVSPAEPDSQILTDSVPGFASEAPVQSSLVSAVHALEGHRLFFTQEQRLQGAHSNLSTAGGDRATTTIDHSDQSSSELDTDAAALIAGNPIANDTTGLTSGKPPIGVFFNGLVSGSNGIRLLINGLPCAVARSPGANEEKAAEAVRCPLVAQTHPALDLALLGGRLQVSRRHSLIGVLNPGQGL